MSFEEVAAGTGEAGEVMTGWMGRCNLCGCLMPWWNYWSRVRIRVTRRQVYSSTPSVGASKGPSGLFLLVVMGSAPLGRRGALMRPGSPSCARTP